MIRGSFATAKYGRRPSSSWPGVQPQEIVATTQVLAESQNQRTSVRDVNMAFGQMDLSCLQSWGVALVVTHKSDFHWAGPSGITTGWLPVPHTIPVLSAGLVPGGVTTVAGAVV